MIVSNAKRKGVQVYLNCKKALLVMFFILGLSLADYASVFNCYPSLGYYNTGTVNSAGIKTQTSLLYAIGGGGERAWMKFEISDVPDGATINSVTLHYYVSSENAPYYQFRKVTSDPVTATGSTLFNEIGSGSSYITITAYNGGWNTRLLGGSINTDVQNALASNWFCIGLHEYEASSNWWLWVDGWNQSNQPYLEINYTVNYSNEIALDSITSPVNLSCEGLYPVKVKIRNGGVNAITSATISWAINGVSQPNYAWTGNLAVNASVSVTLATINFSPGSDTVYANVYNPNGVLDPFMFNNAKTAVLQIIPKPLITAQPADISIGVGGNAVFSLLATGGNITYQWQVSMDNGLNFYNLFNVVPYSNVTTNLLQITGATQNMNAFKYRCIVTGYCSPIAISDTVILTVGPPITALAGHSYTCSGNLSSIPLIVKDLHNATAFTLTLNYNSAGISYQSFNSLNPLLNGIFSVINASGHLTIQYNGSSGFSLINDTVCKLVFQYNSNSNLDFDTLVPGHCQFNGSYGLVYPSHYTNGYINNGAPNIVAQPADKYTIVGIPTLFTVSCTGAPVYQWQVSVNAGNSWVNLTNNVTYSGVNNDSLWVIPTLSMNTYKYRCIINSCNLSLNSNAATMSVIKLVKTWFDTIYDCTCFTPAREIFVPVRVTNFDSINSVSLSFFFKNTALQYISTTYINPALQFPIVFQTVFPTKTMIRIASFTTTGFMAVPDSASLVIMKFRVLCDTTKLQWETWTQGACQYSTGPDSSIYVFEAQFNNGFVLDGGPTVGTSPVNQSVFTGSPATFSCSAISHGGTLTYHWQLSTNGGALYTDLTDNTMYSGVLTNTLNINNITLGMNGYKYRCRLNGLCDEQITNPATLTVSTPPIIVNIPTVNTCFGDTIFVPVSMTNFTGVCTATLTFSYNTSLMSYAGFKNINPQLPNPGNLTCAVNGNYLTISWTSSTPGTLSGTSTLLLVKFTTTQLFTNSPLTWITTPAAYCHFSDCSGGNFTYTFTNSTVTINPLPIVHNVITPMPYAGHFCVGGSGVQIGMDITQFGVNYTLYRDGVVVPGYSGVAGTGFGITFNTFNTPGVYTVRAYFPLTSCSVLMDQFVTVVADPPPTVFNVTGAGSYCFGGAGLPVELSNSQLNVDYFLFRDGFPVDTLVGTGALLSFGNQTLAGTYTIKARNSIYETCLVNMNGSAILTIAPYPVAATSITGPLNVCKGSAYTYTGAPVSGASSYTWTQPLGFTGTSITNTITLTIGTTAVSGNITLAGHNNCGDGPSTTIAVVVHDPPIPVLSAFPSLCKDGGLYVLSGGTPAGGTYSGPTVSGVTFNPAVSGAGTFVITYAVTDVNGCIGTVQGTLTVIDKPKISGVLSYDNASYTGLGNIKVYLKNGAGTLILDSLLTAAVPTYGNFSFKCLSSGTYNFACKVPASNPRPWPVGPVNGTDALLIMKHAVGLLTLSPFRAKAADVNANGSVNSVDALLVMKRFVGTISSFPAGDWIFNTSLFNPINVGATSVTQNVRALVYGDVDASYSPSNIKKAPSVFLEHSGETTLKDLTINEIPFILTESINLGSVSLIISYPSDNLELLEIKSSLQGFLYNVIDGQIRIVWYDLAGRSFKKGDPLFVASARMKQGIIPNDNQYFEVDGASEITDTEAIAYSKVVLNSPQLNYTFIPDNLADQNKDFELGVNQPNPFGGITQIPYYIPEDGRLDFQVLNIMGQLVLSKQELSQPKGEHSITLDGSMLAEGVYTYRLTFYRGKDSKSCSRRMIIHH